MVLIHKSAMENLHKALFTVLGVITTQTGIKIYDHVPIDQEKYPYIVMGDFSEDSWGDKSCPGSVVTVNINSYLQDKSSLPTKILCNKIIELLIPNFSVEGFDLIYSEIDNLSVSEMGNNIFLGQFSFKFYMYLEEDSE